MLIREWHHHRPYELFLDKRERGNCYAVFFPMCFFSGKWNCLIPAPRDIRLSVAEKNQLCSYLNTSQFIDFQILLQWHVKESIL